LSNALTWDRNCSCIWNLPTSSYAILITHFNLYSNRLPKNSINRSYKLPPVHHSTAHTTLLHKKHNKTHDNIST
jgi:hypothetical protein